MANPGADLEPRHTRMLDPGYIRSAASYSALNKGLSLIVFQNGHTVFEEYQNGCDPDQGQRLASCVKNFWGVAGIAAMQDNIISLNQRVSTLIPEWREQPGKNDVFVRDLLNMSSGLNPGFKELYFRKVYNSRRTALGLPMDENPQVAFIYGPGNMEVFGEVLARSLRSKNIKPVEYLQHRIISPLGIKLSEWKTDEIGNERMSSGAKMTARGLLNFGRLILGKGNFEGTQIIRETYFLYALQGTTANPAYGTTFWLNRNAAFPDSYEVNVEVVLEQKDRFDDWQGACIAREAPADMITMIGSGNQRVYVIPSLDAVIVRQGDGNTFLDGVFWRLLTRGE